MNRSQRQAISLIMSIVLTVFSLCQVNAWAAALPAVHAEPVATEMVDCHRASPAAEVALPDCCSVCEQLSAHPDVSIKLSSLDHSPIILAIAEPYALPLAPIAAHTRYRPPDHLAVNPPPTIRFQRLLN